MCGEGWLYGRGEHGPAGSWSCVVVLSPTCFDDVSELMPEVGGAWEQEFWRSVFLKRNFTARPPLPFSLAGSGDNGGILINYPIFGIIDKYDSSEYIIIPLFKTTISNVERAHHVAVYLSTSQLLRGFSKSTRLPLFILLCFIAAVSRPPPRLLTEYNAVMILPPCPEHEHRDDLPSLLFCSMANFLLVRSSC